MSAGVVLRLAALVLFVLAALGFYDWIVHVRLATAFGLEASGFACWIASTLAVTLPAQRS